MSSPRESLVFNWKLPVRDQSRLQALSLDHQRKCTDVNTALERLLGDRSAVCDWMWLPAPWLFHARPVDVVLASPLGCSRMRLRLLRELAETGEDDGVLAAIMRSMTRDEA